jgi:outer membrane protein OmpA-like peptidoglycan-associated protein
VKQTVISLGTAFVVVSLFFGCGKKKEERIEKRPERLLEEAQLDQLTPEEAYVFDEAFKDFENFNDQYAFIDEEDTSGPEGLNLASDDTEEASDYNFKNIQFNYNSDVLGENQLTLLHADIEEAKRAVEEGKSIEVRGYRCQMGEPVFNFSLSQRSANSVKNTMIQHGIPADRITSIGDGQEQALVLDDDPACDRNERIKKLAPNRRVEILAV